MQGKATIAGHPIHPMLVALPIGFFVGALVCDIILAMTHDPFWPAVSVVLIGFGVRLALGAQRAQVMGLVLRQGVRLAIAGASIGLARWLVVSHAMSGLLYLVSPTDPVTFVVVTGALTAVAGVARYLPARRAIRVDPPVALRY